jgi:hypothetical protein
MEQGAAMTIQEHIVLLTIAYASLAAMVLAMLIRLAMPRWVKIAAIVVMSVFDVGVFFWSQGLVGWSSATAVPERFQLLWSRVVEPSPSRGLPGAIHLWVEALDDSNLPSGKPRAFLLPYSAELAGKVTVAQAEIKKGNPQGGRAEAFTVNAQPAGGDSVNVRDASQGVAPGGDPSGGGLLDPAFLGGQSKSVDLIPMPKPLLPPKEAP